MNSLKMYDTLSFFDPSRIGEKFIPNIKLAREEGRKLRLRPAYKDVKAGKGFLSIFIDEEDDFMDDGRLPVKGAYASLRRALKRGVELVRSETLTSLIVTIDAHPPHTIHSDSWWIDEMAQPVVLGPVGAMMMRLDDPKAKLPFESIFLDGRAPKRFRPKYERDWTVNTYAPHLELTKQGNIWVFADHCHIGTDGTNLSPALVEYIEWAAAARDIQPTYMWKGHIAKTDWFGPFRPCIDVPDHAQGSVQTEALDQIKAATGPEVVGQALDFCVKNGMLQIIDYYDNPTGRSVLESVYFVTDCSDAIVPDDPAKGSTPNAAFLDLMRTKGIKMITHDAPLS